MVDGQFAVLGLVLMGLLARINASILVPGTPVEVEGRGGVASFQAILEAEGLMAVEDLGRPVLRSTGSLGGGHAEDREKPGGRQEVLVGPKECEDLSSGTGSQPYREVSTFVPQRKFTKKKKGAKGQNAIDELFSGVG